MSSLVVRAEYKVSEALEGRRVAGGIVLPSNPVLSFSAAQRRASTPDQSAFNWYATLSQELEIAGQRGARVRAADAAVEAQEKKVRLSKREVAASAWVTYFEMLAAREQLSLSEELTSASGRVAVTIRARADKGLTPTLDADLADVASVRASQSRTLAAQSLATAEAKLKSLLGIPLSQPLQVQGELIPVEGLPVSPVSAMKMPPASERLEFKSAAADERAMLARAQGFRRSRVPNPSVSLFVQNDGFNERVLGLGLSLPLPLPAPLGRTYAGEIQEAEALADRAGIEKQRLARSIELEAVDALNTYRTQARATDALTPEKRKSIEQSLRDLRVEVETGRVAVRDAIAAQQTMLDLLQTDVAQRKNLCVASVRLALAFGIPLEGGER